MNPLRPFKRILAPLLVDPDDPYTNKFHMNLGLDLLSISPSSNDESALFCSFSIVLNEHSAIKFARLAL